MGNWVSHILIIRGLDPVEDLNRFASASNSVDFIHQLRSTSITVEKWYGDLWLHILLRKKMSCKCPAHIWKLVHYSGDMSSVWQIDGVSISWTAHQEHVMKVSLAYCSEHLISTIHEISTCSISVSLGKIETLLCSSNLSENQFSLAGFHWVLLWYKSALKHHFILCTNFHSS